MRLARAGGTMTASASVPMPRRTEAAAVAPSQAARPTARAAKPAAAKTGEAERPSARRSPPKTSGNAPALAFAAVVAAALIYGWQMRDEDYLTPDSGVGYWLGIGGASAMLLLGYPLRKRLTGLQILGSVTGWFRVHMLLGVIAPALIPPPPRSAPGRVQDLSQRTQDAHLQRRSAQSRNLQPRFCQFHPDRVSQTRKRRRLPCKEHEIPRDARALLRLPQVYRPPQRPVGREVRSLSRRGGLEARETLRP
jgi:hypothetical protein